MNCTNLNSLMPPCSNCAGMIQHIILTTQQSLFITLAWPGSHHHSAVRYFDCESTSHSYQVTCCAVTVTDSTDSNAAPYQLSAFARYRRGHQGDGGQPYLHWRPLCRACWRSWHINANKPQADALNNFAYWQSPESPTIMPSNIVVLGWVLCQNQFSHNCQLMH